MAGAIDLFNLASRDGFLIKGNGIADLIVGAPDADQKSGTSRNPHLTGEDYVNSPGKAHVTFGNNVADSAAAFGTIDLGALDPAEGVIIQGRGLRPR